MVVIEKSISKRDRARVKAPRGKQSDGMDAFPVPEKLWHRLQAEGE